MTYGLYMCVFSWTSPSPYEYRDNAGRKTQQKFGVNFRIEGKVEMKSNQIETQLEVNSQLIPFVTI